MSISMFRSFLQTSSRLLTTRSNLSFGRRVSLTQPKLRFFSSGSDSSKFFPAENNNASADVEDVSTAELKRRIENMSKGDADAIPSIFEAILRRKLAGNHDDSDEELMEELRSRSAEDEETDSDSEQE